MIRYEIRRDDGQLENSNILERFYGATWQSVLDRLHHRHDGYLFAIYDKCRQLRIYRVFDRDEILELS
jgi:hypothetical protein